MFVVSKAGLLITSTRGLIYVPAEKLSLPMFFRKKPPKRFPQTLPFFH